MNETIDLLMKHRSIRKYSSREVTEEQLQRIVQAAQMASSSSSVQAYSVIAVTDPEQKQTLSVLAGNQAYIAECPVFLVWCADLYRLKQAGEQHLDGAESYIDSTENFIIATVDASLAAQNAAVAAESMGLGIVYIGGVRNQIAEFSEVLQLPELVYPVFGMCLGYPDQQPDVRPRLPLEGVLHRGTYNASSVQEQVANYDNTYTAYMQARSGGGKPAAGWSQFMAKRLAEPVRLHMKDFLQHRGMMRR
ncbi:oxygen-insensitive NADPH nitroreductase [Paenibacillus lemnae]|uniref:Oxygen-insensitive NADPH nitroreductase n=1 Tax=Paenibacillus lemnae TaxID=1330551 RepID=A0A848M5X1_PAELE|nr:oxygen-insensitive NADPH nitroreductase [Paenibacillus lemnae]NMO96357.1 oxygen-insensitive NADPH nitroreductase [Paenibacillus lemnae]